MQGLLVNYASLIKDMVVDIAECQQYDCVMRDDMFLYPRVEARIAHLTNFLDTWAGWLYELLAPKPRAHRQMVRQAHGHEVTSFSMRLFMTVCPLLLGLVNLPHALDSLDNSVSAITTQSFNENLCSS